MPMDTARRVRVRPGRFRSAASLGDRPALRRALTCRGLVATALLLTAMPRVEAQTQAEAGGLEEVVVTARKRAEAAIDVPESITAFSAATLERLGVQSFTDYATKTPNLSFSYGTANYGYVDSHTVAIRGVAGLGTTGIYIDDTPVPDSIDPRVVDIRSIEILKGPQGTLFGQGSIGGNLRLITVEPSPGATDGHVNASMGGTSGAGSPDYGLDFAGTTQLIGDNVLVRAVGFYDHAGGYLHHLSPDSGGSLQDRGNYGATTSYGGSLALRWIATDRLDVLLRLMAQQQNQDGWIAPYAPLPTFSIPSLTMDRTNDIRESARDRWYMPTLTLNFRGSGFDVHSSTSYFDRRSTDLEDGTEGTSDYLNNLYSGLGVGAIVPTGTPFGWSEIVTYRRIVHETRINFDKLKIGEHQAVSGVAGVYFSRSFSNTELDAGRYAFIRTLGLNTNAVVPGYCNNPNDPADTSCASYGNDQAWYSNAPTYHRDRALFGELYYDFHDFELTAGLRAYKQTQDGHQLELGALNQAELNLPLPETSQSGVTPKLALSYKFAPQAMAYLSYSKGFRSGGSGVPLPSSNTPPIFFQEIHQTGDRPTTYVSDTVSNYEIGAKYETADHQFVVTGAVFQMNWRNIQQGVVAPGSEIALIVNAGDARIRGAELELAGRPLRNLELRAGLGYEDAVITNGELYWQPTGSPVYQVPKITAATSGTLTLPVTDALSSFVTLDYSHTGSSVSGTTGCQLNTGANPPPGVPADTHYFPCPNAGPGTLMGVAPTRAGYSLLNARLGLSWGRSELALYLDNITRARPNLGDFNPAAYPKHSADPAQQDPTYGEGWLIPRAATLQPFHAGLQYRQQF